MKLRAIIIDDEPKNIRVLSAMCQEFLPSVSIIDSANTIEDGVRMAKTLKPDVVFLDIRISFQDDGFQFFNYFPQGSDFEVVFVTAYEDYIRRAFNHTSAIGYLLKPIDPDELTTVVYKIKQKLLANNTHQVLIDDIKRINEVLYLYIEDKTVRFKLIDNKEKIALKPTLEEYEYLPDFFRINRKEIINMNFLKKVSDINDNGEKSRNADIILLNGEAFSVSQSRKTEFMKKCEKYLS